MNERVGMTESGARPDEPSAAPNPNYFPRSSYGTAAQYAPPPQAPQPYQPQAYPGQGYPPQAQAPQYYAPQGYPPQAYAPQGYPQSYPAQGYPAQGYAAQGHYPPPHHQAPASYHPASPGYGPAPYAPPEPLQREQPAQQVPAQMPANVDDAVAQIAARMRALDTDPAAAEPSQPPLAHPPSNYGPDESYAPPQAPQQHYAPPLAPAHPDQPAYAGPQRHAPGPDLSGLESQIRNLTAQIETLRQPVPDFSGALQELRADLSEISSRLLEAMPRRAIEALEAEVRRLAERIDFSRAAGVDPDAIAGMERSLTDVREAIRSLKPAESLAGFEQAIRNLSERLDQSAGTYQDPASLQQLESSIVALRGIVANVASNDTLAGLSEEIRGLSAKVERVAATSRGFDSDMLQTLEQRIAALPVLGAIERGFADLKARFDQIPVTAHQPVIDPTPAVDHLKRDLLRTQDSLEAVHSTLGHLVDRLAMIEGGIREARFAAEAPMPMPAPAMPAPAERRMPKAELPQMPADMPRASAPGDAPQPSSPAMPRPAAEPRPAAANAPKSTSTAAPMPQPAQSKPAPASMRERQAIDPSLPPDFPLEPGSGTPRVRPPASAAERIAASEAALGAAKPAGANHPGQTNFIAAARRAAQAAAAAAPEISAERPDEAAEDSGKSISRKVRALFVGASALILIAASARVAIDLFDTGTPPVTELSEPAEDAQPQQQSRPLAAAPVMMPSKPDIFAVPPSGVIERPTAALQQPVSAPAAPDATGSIGPAGPLTNPVVQPAPPLARGPMPPLPDKLPAALRNAAVKGQPAAEFEIGIRLIEGRGVAKNTDAGLRWLERAAEAGLAPAHFRIAGLYEKGLGVKKNLSIARRHYIAAAEKGNAKAMHNMAVLYAEGIDGKADYKTAAEWFRRAADYGVADSQYNLAILHARGIGVDQNILESYKWLALAALQGDNDAAKKRDEIGSKLDAASLAAARKAVQSFTPQPQPDDAVTVTAPPGGWDRPTAESAPGKKPRAGSVVKVTAS